MGERAKLIGSYEALDTDGKTRRVWIFRYGYNRYLMVDWRSVRHSVPRSQRDLGAVGYEVEAILGLRNAVWKPLPKWEPVRTPHGALGAVPHFRATAPRPMRMEDRPGS